MVVVGGPTLTGYLTGLALATIGQAVRIWAAGHLVKSEVLTVAGPFAWVRNPLYIGSLAITCGYCSMTGGAVVWAIMLPLFVLFHGAAVTWEERFLTAQFGELFEEYQRSVPRFIPRWPMRPTADSSQRFSLGRVRLNGEDRTLLGTLAVVVAFGLKLALGW